MRIASRKREANNDLKRVFACDTENVSVRMSKRLQFAFEIRMHMIQKNNVVHGILQMFHCMFKNEYMAKGA